MPEKLPELPREDAPARDAGPPRGRPRRTAILSLLPDPLPRPVIDVGCDHGHVAASLGAIASERERHRLPQRADLRLVVADGLRPFRRVGLAVIAGMGASKIQEILSQGPRPDHAILHAADRPDRLRAWCGLNDWRIVDERLAPEDDRFAEVLHVVPGQETHRSHELWFGPFILAQPDARAHLALRLAWWRGFLSLVQGHDTRKRAEAEGWIHFLENLL